MRLKTKKWLILAVSVMFTLTISYFAVLSPTTAWFYTQSDKNYKFVFGDVGLDLPENEATVPATVRLKAATRCADFDENNFDAALYVVEVEAINTGTAAARVWVHPSTINNTTMNGLYFFATCHRSNEENLPSIKEELEDMLSSRLLSRNVTPVAFGASGYDAYESSVLSVDMTDYMNNAYVVVPPSTTSIIRVAFWVEYNSSINSENVGSSFENNGNTVYADVIKEFDNLGINILLTATQDGVGVSNPNV